jgi:hypothetical protein
MPRRLISFETIVDSGDTSLFDVRTKAAGPQGSLPITAEMLLNRPSGDLFGWSQNAGMGWNPKALGGKEILILNPHGGASVLNPHGGASAIPACNACKMTPPQAPLRKKFFVRR